MTGTRLTIRDIITICCLLVGNFIDGVSYSIVVPFLPPVALAKGCTKFQYGVIIAGPSIAALVSSPLAGYIIPKIGIGNTANIGLLIVSAATFLFGYTPLLPDGYAFFWSCLVLRFLDGLGDGLTVTAACTAIAYLYPDHKVILLAIDKACFGAGMVLGSVMGGLLYEAGGFSCPFIVTGVIPLVIAVVLWFAMKEERKPATTDEEPEKKTVSQLKMLVKIGIFLNVAGVALGAIDNNYVDTTLGIHLNTFNVSPLVKSVAFGVRGVSYILLGYLFGRLVETFKGAHTLIIANLLIAIVLVFGLSGPVYPFPAYDNIALVMIRQIALGATAALVTCTFLDGLSELSFYGYREDIGSTAAFSALYNFGLNIGALVGPVFGGFLMDQIGYAKGSLVMIALQVAYLIPYVGFVIRRRMTRNSSQTSLQRLT